MCIQTIIHKRFKDPTDNLPGSDLLQSFLKTGTTNEDIQQEGKLDSANHLLYSPARTGESSGEQILRTMAGILLGPVAVDASR